MSYNESAVQAVGRAGRAACPWRDPAARPSDRALSAQKDETMVARKGLFGQPLPPSRPQAASPPLVTWRGISGRTYQFELHPAHTVFNALPGVYIMCKEVLPGQWFPAYIGEAEDLDARAGAGLARHEKWKRAYAMGATHICGLVVRGGKSVRCAVEADLRHFNSPPLSDQ